jgi:cellulose synthase/poly-beta-1,6-N-acetylglucosamine synthase-like glycosyltransferase
MADLLTIIFLFYTFISLYFIIGFTLIYIPNRRKFTFSPESTKNYTLSIVVPCFNEEKTIGKTIETLLNLDYKYLKKIILVDDRSTDSSYSIMKKYALRYPQVMAVQTPKNTGNAAGAKNYGAKFVDTPLIGFTDADSFPKKDSVSKMIGFFDDPKVGAVTASVLVKQRNNLLELLQAVEYKIIGFTRKLLGMIEAIYVTPGPLAVYRKEAFDKVGRFDESNLTEDIEITWAIVSAGYKVEMSLKSEVYSVAPSKVSEWFKQRLRWNIGGIQTMFKYANHFSKKGRLRSFILPFFLFSWSIALFGIMVLLYRLIRMFIIRYLSTIYSIQAETAILRLSDINLTPNILIFLGGLVLILSIFFSLFALFYVKERDFKKYGFFPIITYMFFYVLAYPFILIASLYKFIRKTGKW